MAKKSSKDKDEYSSTKKKSKKYVDDDIDQDSYDMYYDQENSEEEYASDIKNIELKIKGEKALERELEKDDLFAPIDEDELQEHDDYIDIKDMQKAAEEFEEYMQERNSNQDLYEGVSIEDSVRLYLKEIGQYNLLTLEHEKVLTERKQKAQALLKKKKLNQQLPVSQVVRAQLTEDELRIIKSGEVSQQRLIECNLRLVVSIAKKYMGNGLSLLDLIQEGSTGLMRGIEKFDYTLGYKLSTYVTWWIRQAVSRALADQSKTIRIPVHMVETINKLNKVKKKLIAKNGTEPSTEEIAKEMKISVEKVEEVIQIAMDPISLDKPVGDEDDSIVADFIADKNIISPEQNAEQVLLREQIVQLLSTLKERERKVIELRFGIGDGHNRTLEDVGRELNVTRERIRQIEDKALRKLRFRAKNLQGLVK